MDEIVVLMACQTLLKLNDINVTTVLYSHGRKIQSILTRFTDKIGMEKGVTPKHSGRRAPNDGAKKCV